MSESNAQKHKIKSILVTGGAGFIGSHVVEYLVINYPEYDVVNLDILDYCSTRKNIQFLEKYKNYHFVEGNILSHDLINFIMTEFKIDTVVHFAAQTHVDNSFGNSLQFTYANVLGTHVLCECAKKNKVSRFIHVSTDEVYGEVETDAVENTILDPTNPYSASKAAAEHIVKSYFKSFKLPIIITRSNNIYGTRQFPEKLIPKCICLLANDKPCFIHGNGSKTRKYLYVKDVVSAFDTIIHKGEVGNTYNIGTDNEKSIKEVVTDLVHLMKGEDADPSKYMNFVEDRLFNDLRYAVDSKKLISLGWKPKQDWLEGLKHTIEWYKKNAGNWDNLSSALVAHPRLNGKESFSK